MAAVRERIFEAAHERAVRAGKVPRSSYAHYFIEAEGLHSRMHLQNFYSTFWPDVEEPAVANVRAFGADGTSLGSIDVELPRFGSMFLEIEDLLERLGADASEGIVAADLEPPAAVRARFADLPSPESAHLNTPFWMAYRDASENYMYVHSIEMLGRDVHGTSGPLRWHLNRAAAQRETWRSWRLLDVELLDEIQVVAINHGGEPGRTVVGIYDADGPALWERELELGPRQLERVRVPGDEVEAWRTEGRARQVRIGLDPLLTTNGKPYVIMRYGGGPLSLHHG
jgi:hypothetical protein